ncbi:MAG: lysine--tRNA ligase, partial [Pseudomonadota bacterium]
VYRPGVSPENNPRLDEMVGYAIKYYERFIAPTKNYRAPTEQERAGLEDLVTRLRAMPQTQDVDALQTTVFDAGKAVNSENLRQWFKGIYEVCFGQSEGPRMGNFIAIYGVKNTADMIETTLAKA